jgi:hypothetical protein
MCKNCADLLIGGTSSKRSHNAWCQAYRSVNHGAAKKACKNQNVMKKFPKEIEDFGNEFVQSQIKRHSADYDPNGTYTRFDVMSDIDAAELAIKELSKANVKDRRAFAAWVTMSNRTD